MKFSNFSYENQTLATYLMQNEARMKTSDFFQKLKQDEELDSKNCKVRETWVHDQETGWCGQYMVVFGRHFSVRAWQRLFNLSADEVVEAVMRQLSNNELALALTSHPIYWEDGKVLMGEDNVKSIAVIEEGTPFVCVYQCGDSYICPVTIWAKDTDMHVNKNTLVLSVSKTGAVCKL